MKVAQSSFGNDVLLFTIENDHGVSMEVTNFGARIVNLFVLTESGRNNIVLGFDSIEDYKRNILWSNNRKSRWKNKKWRIFNW